MKTPFNTRYFIAFFGISLLIIAACNKEREDFITEGKKPVYISKEEASKIDFLAPQPLKNPGKIYIYGNLLLVVELYKGVHIINNANPAFPQVIKFVEVPGAKDIAVKQNMMYVDNYTDLVVINISNIYQPTLSNRIKNIYSRKDEMYPEVDGWFECVDTTRGIVAYWVDAELKNPKCSRGVTRWN